MSFRRFNIFGSNSSINNTRPPTYASKTTAAPSYRPSISERSVVAWNGSSRSAWSTVSPDADSVFDQVESTLTDTEDIRGTSADTRRAGPRYGEFSSRPYYDSFHHQLFSVYYRLYTEDGAIPSANHVYSDDPYLGRILAELVAPPHIAMSLKHCLLSVENMDNKTTASLFISSSSQTPLGDTDRLSILATLGPGWLPNEPMALVVNLSESCRSPLDERKPEAVLLPTPEGPTPFETRYSALYKRLLKIFYLTDWLL